MSAQGDTNLALTAEDQIAEVVLPGKRIGSANSTSSTYSFISTQDSLPAEKPSKEAQVIPIVGPVSLDQDLRTLPYVPQEPEGKDEERLMRHPPGNGLVVSSDPSRLILISPLPSAMPTPLQTFAGLTSAQCGSCYPPDTVGDVGTNHYVQAVNSSFKIMDKTGTELVAPTTYNSLFSALGLSTPCGNRNRGDGIVFYDHIADRWVISDFAWPSFPGVSFYQCIAVSKTADPVAGGWWLYALQFDPVNPNFMGDYPKFGVWPDAYYLSVNMYSNGNTFNGVRVYALPRNAMINGTGAPNSGAIAFSISPETLGDSHSLLPATFRSGLPPVSGGTVTPEYFMAINSSAAAGAVENQVFTWRFHADFATPANSTLGVGANHTPDGTITVNNFVDAFAGSGTMIVPQTGTTAKLDSRGDSLMYPLVYQNLGGVESIYASHTVNNNQNGTGPTAIRWYQFDVTGNTIPATPTQQQTFDNGGDGLWRFMPSLNVDGAGNLAIGYSESSDYTNPAIAYAGRLVADPPNTLAQGEAILIQGAGHQTGTGRWGDYGSTFVDPDDRCTFWHTGEYFSVTSGSGWNTRIGNFKFPTCSAEECVRANVALSSSGATVAVSSEQGSGRFPAVSAINGDRTGATWGTSTGGWNDATRDVYPDTFEVDFPVDETIDEIDVFTLQNNWTTAGEPSLTTPASSEGILDFNVQYCSGNCTSAPVWTTISGGSVTGNDKAWRRFTLSPAIATSKIRVVVNNSRDHWSRIVEIEAYGCPSTTTPTRTLISDTVTTSDGRPLAGLPTLMNYHFGPENSSFSLLANMMGYGVYDYARSGRQRQPGERGN